MTCYWMCCHSMTSHSMSMNMAMGGNNCSRSNLSVMSNNSRMGCNLLRSLTALGCDDLFAVLNGGNINMSGTYSLGNFPRSGDWDILALLDWHTVTHWGRHHWRGSISIARISFRISISCRLSISITLSKVMSVMSNSSMASNRSGNRMTMSYNSMAMSSSNRVSMSNSHSRGGNNSSGNNLRVLANNGGGMVCGLRDLLASCSDNFFTMLSDYGVKNLIIFLMANFSWGFYLSWNTGFLRDRMTNGSRHSSLSICVSWVRFSIRSCIRAGIRLSVTFDKPRLG